MGCGDNHSIILSSNGMTLSCGGVRKGRNDGNVYEPIKAIKALETEVITSLAVGKNHTLCLNKKRQVWSFGEREKGALGHGNKEYQDKPKMIEYFSANNIE